MRPLQRLLRFFFRLLYHPFAFSYDLVAAAVSFGRWKDWVFGILPLIEGARVLELGHGPGHLQRLLLDRGLFAAAIDESKQMGGIARRRLGRSHKLTRGLAQALPYPGDSFDTVVSTFPSEYIFEAETVSEAKRVLRNGGRFVVLPAAFPKNRFLEWLFKVTGESPAALDEAVRARFKEPFIKAGFPAETRTIELQSSLLIVVVGRKE
jgi:ubiquinone/menaquinone biosynthesis C-methylase UbiE